MVDGEEFWADTSEVDENEELEEEYYEDMYADQIKRFDRSFKQVYVGYADGIDLNALDNTKNWQFK